MKFFILFIIFLMVNQNVVTDEVTWNQSEDHQKNNTTPVSSWDPYKTPTKLDGTLTKNLVEGRKNFEGRNLYIVAIKFKGIFELQKDDKKLTGVIGDLWSILAEYLNFTLVIREADNQTYIFETLQNCTVPDGILEWDKCDIRAFLGIQRSQFNVIDFTQCFWREGNLLFVKPKYHFKTTWMLHILSQKIWLRFIVTYLLSSVTSFITRNVIENDQPHGMMMAIMGHFFYCFGAFCNQGGEFSKVHGESRILSLCVNLLSWFLIVCFSSQIYIEMTQSILVPPFTNLETLFYDTDYIVLVRNTTVAHRAFKEKYEPILEEIMEANRIRYYSGDQDFKPVWNDACSDDVNAAAFHFPYLKPVTSNQDIPCHLESVGESRYSVCITATVPKNSAFKKPINYGIIKLHESGIIDILRTRWLRSERLKGTRPYSAIEMDQVYLPIGLFISGSFLSLMILVIESIFHARKR